MSPLLYRVLSVPLMIILLSSSALANDALLVKGVAVDVSAESALAARNKAFAEARRKAYQSVAAASLPADALENLVIPDDAVLASMVRDFEIENEKMTSRRYVAKVNVRFNPSVRRAFNTRAAAVPDAVPDSAPQYTSQHASPVGQAREQERDYVYSPARANNQPSTRPVAQNVAQNVATTERAKPILVLPWYGSRGQQTLWGNDNPWRAAWENSANALSDPSMPVLLPVGDVDDVRDYAPPQPLSERGNVTALLNRYKATDAVLALAEPAEGGAIIVSLFRLEGASPISMGRFGVDAGAGRNSLQQAVTRTLDSLRTMPRTQDYDAGMAQTYAQPYNPNAPYNPSTYAASTTMPATQPMGSMQAIGIEAHQFTALARFSGLQQWVQIRNALSATPGVQALDIQSISPAQAQLQFNYNGTSQALTSILAQSGLQLVPLSAGNASTVSGAAAPTHQLTQIGSF